MRPSPTSSPSRRQFLVQTAAVAGAGAILGSCGTAPDTRPMPKARTRAPLAPDDPIRMAVIGTGGMGTAHCNSFTNLAKKGRDQVEIVALCDVCESRLENAKNAVAKNQGSTPDTYARHEDLLAREDIHGVLIAAPEHWHAQLAEDALAAGKDVYLEKPMTLRLDDALRLRKVCQANPDMIMQVGTQYIMGPKYHEARKLIGSGAIGKPVNSQTSYCRNSKNGEWNYYSIDPKWQPGVNLDWERWCGPLGMQDWDPLVYGRWRRYRRYSTGIIGDLLVHQMTPLIFAMDMGWPTRVVASGGHYVDKAMENHDQVNIQVEFENEHTMVVAGSTCNEQGLEVMVRGHQGTLYMGGKDVLLRPERIYADEVDEQPIKCKSQNDHDEIRLDWLASIRSRKPNASPVDLGTKVMVIVDLATRSMWEGRAWSFDSKSMTAKAL